MPTPTIGVLALQGDFEHGGFHLPGLRGRSFEVGREIGLTRERVRQIQVEALKRLREILEKQDFDLVITDLHMPKGGGQQLIEWCLKNKPRTKLLAISGEDLDVTLSALEIVETKGIPTLEKPFEMTQLETIIHGMMSNQFL